MGRLLRRREILVGYWFRPGEKGDAGDGDRHGEEELAEAAPPPCELWLICGYELGLMAAELE